MEQTIHVVYAFNDIYTESASVSMASMLHNTTNPVHIHIVGNRLSDKNKNILLSLGENFPHGLLTFHSTGNIDTGDLKFEHQYFTHEVNFRLIFQEIFPNLSRIIYLDCDTIVEGDITELWELDLGDKLLGAWSDLVDQRLKTHVGIAGDGFYFNSGVLLLDLQKLREFELFEKAKSVAPAFYKRYAEKKLDLLPNQDFMNYLFYDKYHLLPAKFNAYLYHTTNYRLSKYSLQELSDMIANPVIHHYTSSPKPHDLSKKAMRHPTWERYYLYKAMTPFADVEGDNKRIAKYRECEARMDDSIIFPDKYIEYKRHALFTELANNLADMLNGRKLALWGMGMDIKYIMAMLATQNIYADMLVDGLAKSREEKIFHYQVESPENLLGKQDDYFVLLCMRNEKPAAEAIKKLIEYGYDKSAYHHIFKPLWDIINKES